MADFTEVSRTGWFQRIGDSIKGIVIGIAIFLASFVVLWKNEGCSVRQYRTISEGRGAVVPAEATSVDKDNDGKLVLMSATAETTDTVADPLLKVSATGIRLERKVEMYQWVEKTETRTKKNLGGSETKETDYTYTREWRSSPVDSSKFNERGRQEGKVNPPMTIGSDKWFAKDVSLGAFRLPATLIEKIPGATDISLDSTNLAALPEDLRSRASLQGNAIYIKGLPSATPIVNEGTTAGEQIGDMRISFSLVEPSAVTVLAQQKDDTFQAYQTKNNPLFQLRAGMLGPDEFFAKMEGENKAKTWLLRILGFAMMVIGISMLLKPLEVLADVIPLLGNIVGAGVFIISLLVALPLSLSTVAVAWIYYRPLLGIPLFIVSAVLVGVLIGKIKSGRKAATPEVAGAGA